MTYRVGAFVLIVSAVVLVQQFPGEADASPKLALALGFSLIAASLLGEVATRLRLPRLSGYLIFGLLCGPYLLNLITASTLGVAMQVVETRTTPSMSAGSSPARSIAVDAASRNRASHASR